MTSLNLVNIIHQGSSKHCKDLSPWGLKFLIENSGSNEYGCSIYIDSGDEVKCGRVLLTIKQTQVTLFWEKHGDTFAWYSIADTEVTAYIPAVRSLMAFAGSAIVHLKNENDIGYEQFKLANDIYKDYNVENADIPTTDSIFDHMTNDWDF